MISNKDKAKQRPVKDDGVFDVFRNNFRLLQAAAGLSVQNLGRELKFKKQYRADCFIRGTATPTVEDLISISQYFDISIDTLLFKQLKVQ